MMYYEISSSYRDWTGAPECTWLDSWYVPRSCRKCRSLIECDMSEFYVALRDHPPHDEAISFVERACVSTMHRALFNVLSGTNFVDDFHVGDVQVRGDVSKDCVAFVAKRSEVRVPIWGSVRTDTPSPCSACGRAFQAPVGDPIIHMYDLQGKAVVSSVSGTRLIVCAGVLASMQDCSVRFARLPIRVVT